jgi:hypothetical protein
LSPELIDADHRRLAARVTLGVVVTVITSLILFSGGPKGQWVFAQQTSPTTGVEFVNPDTTTSNEISWKDDTSGGSTGTTYHLVAWVRNAASDATVTFSYNAEGATPVPIGTATRVGSTETFEFHWPSSSAPADGEYTLTATLNSGGATSTDTETVDVNNADDEPPGGLDPRTEQAETVEITAPANGGALAFTEDPDADIHLKATIQVKHSADVTTLAPYYSTSAPGTEPAFKACENDPETAEQAANGVNCELPAGTNGTSVTGVAVVASDNPVPMGPGQTEDEESGDAHRVFGTGASPGPSSSSPSPTASSTSPSPTASSTSPSPTQSSASPTPTETTPPPPVIYPSTTTLKVNGNKFTGKVKSRHANCRRGRNVLLKKEKPGKDKTVGKDRTNRRGTYSIKEKNPNGTYYTVAKTKRFTTGAGGPVTCDSDRSPKRKA